MEILSNIPNHNIIVLVNAVDPEGGPGCLVPHSNLDQIFVDRQLTFEFIIFLEPLN